MRLGITSSREILLNRMSSMRLIAVVVRPASGRVASFFCLGMMSIHKMNLNATPYPVVAP